MHGGSRPVSLWGVTLLKFISPAHRKRAATPPIRPRNTAQPGTPVSRGKSLAHTPHSSRGAMSLIPPNTPPGGTSRLSHNLYQRKRPHPLPNIPWGKPQAAAAAVLPSSCCLQDSPRASGITVAATAQPAPGAAGPAGPSSGMGLSPLSLGPGAPCPARSSFYPTGPRRLWLWTAPAPATAPGSSHPSPAPRSRCYFPRAELGTEITFSFSAAALATPRRHRPPRPDPASLPLPPRPRYRPSHSPTPPRHRPHPGALHTCAGIPTSLSGALYKNPSPVLLPPLSVPAP